MPYNTRRKSLSLPSLGIQLPNTTRPHRSSSKSASPEQVPQDQSPPAKRVKREHASPSPLPSPRRTPSTDIKASKAQAISSRPGAHTPPPSPGDIVQYRKIDLDGINDDVVVSVIEQLEKTGNRPHLIKELATVLLTTNRNIANSANPAALLSSRLTQYMKRPWTALSPCPVAKELIPVHPRKVFFFLTSQPRGQLPTSSDDIIAPVIADMKRLTPSISDPSIEDEEAVDRDERMRFSPSPEVELFSPELDNASPVPPTPGSSFSGHSLRAEPIQPPQTQRSANRAPSPGLEADERGFTETASAVRASRLLQQTSQLQISVQEPSSDDSKLRSDHDAGLELFGRSHGTLSVSVNDHKHLMSSPMMVPKHSMTIHIHDIDMEMGDASWNIKSPEATSFDELDQMFDDL